MSTIVAGSTGPMSALYTYSYEDEKKFDETISKVKAISGAAFYGYGTEDVAYDEDSVSVTDHRTASLVRNEVAPVKPKSNENFLIDFYWNEKFQVKIINIPILNKSVVA